MYQSCKPIFYIHYYYFNISKNFDPFTRYGVRGITYFCISKILSENPRKRNLEIFNYLPRFKPPKKICHDILLEGRDSERERERGHAYIMNKNFKFDFCIYQFVYYILFLKFIHNHIKRLIYNIYNLFFVYKKN